MAADLSQTYSTSTWHGVMRYVLTRSLLRSAERLMLSAIGAHVIIAHA